MLLFLDMEYLTHFLKFVGIFAVILAVALFTLKLTGTA